MNKLQIFKRFAFCFFTRNGGVSKFEFSTLNCAYSKGDKTENVNENRKIACKLFPKKRLILPNQTHSNKVIKVQEKPKTIIHADALISNKKGLLLGILTADCAPIVVLGKNYFGIIHAGWKGALNGIIENTISQFIFEGEKIDDINIFVGPHLKRDSFEIKEDFVKKICKVKNFHQFIFRSKEKEFFDFSKFIESIIVKLKVSNYMISEIDTFKNPNLFFSHRFHKRNKIKNCGRQITLVGIKNI